MVTSPAKRPATNAVAKGVHAGQGMMEGEEASKELDQMERAWEAGMRPPALGPAMRRAERVATAAAVAASRLAGQLPKVGAQVVKQGMGTGTLRMAAARTRCSRKCGSCRRRKEALADISK